MKIWFYQQGLAFIRTFLRAVRADGATVDDQAHASNVLRSFKTGFSLVCPCNIYDTSKLYYYTGD